MDDSDAKVVGMCAGLMVFVFVVMILAAAYTVTSQDQAPKNLPACLEEDGSTQQECMWDDGSGLIVHNWDWGKHYSTYART